ncbi:MAG TPA: galactose-1-epimerase, partial [Opitutales bacterium]|nr:galactose-1-epimerase [Opitutales bacterium]
MKYLILLPALCLLVACQPAQSPTQSAAPVEDFGTLADGRGTQLYTLSNQSGMTAKVADFGATLVSLTAPDREGELADITLGFDSVEGYASEANP